MTSDILTQMQHSNDMARGNTFRQEYLPIPTPTPRCDRYIRQGKSSSSPLQKYPYHQDISNRNTVNQPHSPSLVGDTLDYTKKENYNMHEDLKVNIDVSEQISDRLHRTAQLMRKSRYNRNNSQSDLSDYASST